MKPLKFLSHFFTPRETNNYKARSLHVDFLSLYLVGALILAFTFKSMGTGFNVLGFATDITMEKLLEQTNNQRLKKSLPPLRYNATLSQAAQKKADDMFAKNYWSHFSPDGKTPWDFIMGAGYRYEYAGENLAKNFLFSQGVVDAWMASPTHRENILRKDYTEVGYAIANGVMNGEETTLVVQMFGTPLKEAAAPQASNQTLPVEPTMAPLAISKGNDAVLGQDTTKSISKMPAFSFNVTYVFMFFFLAALIADFYLASKLNIVRVGSKHVAHILFLTFVLLGVLFVMKNGAIL